MRNLMKRILEISCGEGGDDAKLLVYDLSQVYIRYFNKAG